MITEAHQAIRECEAKMARYRAALDAGGDVEEITSWINAAKAERLQAEATICSAAAPARLSRQEITTVVEYFADLAAVVRDADPTDKAEIYRGLNLVLTYQPAAQVVHAQAHLAGDPHGVMVRVRGRIAPKSPCMLTGEFALGSQ
jgi:hypothetical protein